jgi:hypothetical protein
MAAQGDALAHDDSDIRWICHNVVDRGALLRLCDKSLDVLSFRVGIDLIGHLDATEAIADVLVYAEDALNIHISFDDCRDGSQLNIAVLGNRGNSRCQATRQSDQDIFNRRGPFVLGGENLGMVGVKAESSFVLLFLAQAIKALDRGIAVRPVLPFASCSPLEQRSLWSLAERLPGRNLQRLRHCQQSCRYQPWHPPSS